MGRCSFPLIFLASVMLSCRKMDGLGRTEIEKGTTLWQQSSSAIFSPYTPGSSTLAFLAVIREGRKALIPSSHGRGEQAEVAYSTSFSTQHKVTSQKKPKNQNTKPET